MSVNKKNINIKYTIPQIPANFTLSLKNKVFKKNHIWIEPVYLWCSSLNAACQMGFNFICYVFVVAFRSSVCDHHFKYFCEERVGLETFLFVIGNIICWASLVTIEVPEVWSNTKCFGSIYSWPKSLVRTINNICSYMD